MKRLSSVVKEKTAPEELQALAAAATRPLIVSSAYVCACRPGAGSSLPVQRVFAWAACLCGARWCSVFDAVAPCFSFILVLRCCF